MKLFKRPQFWLGIGFICLIIALRFSGVGGYITLEMIQEKRAQLEQFVSMHYLWSVFAYIIFYIAAAALALPLASLGTVVSGFLFGVIAGTIYTNIGATIGATIFFLLVRYSFGNSLQARYQKQLAWFNKQMDAYGISYLIAVRFLALIPFFVVNLLIGLTNVPLQTFIWTTSLGIIPGSFVYAFAGRQLATMTSLRDIFSLNILLAFALLASLALLPIIFQRYRSQSA